MEFRTEYNLTLSMCAGRALVKALVDYHETLLGSAFQPGTLPNVFDVPGVLHLDNLVVIESHEYTQVPNPVLRFMDHLLERADHLRWHSPKYEPRREAELEEYVLNVKFVVWQRAPESVNT